MKRTRQALARLLDKNIKAAQSNIPAGALIDQLPSGTLPPATSDARGGVLLSDADPEDISTTAADSGTASEASRADHIHYLDASMLAGVGGATSTGAVGSEPGAPGTGDLYLPNNGFVVERYSGSAWIPWGPLYPFVAPPTSGWSWVNQGSATIDTTNGGICLTEPGRGTGTNFRCYVRSAPSTPYVIDTFVLNNILAKNYLAFGLMFRQSSDGKCVFFFQQYNSVQRIGVDNFTDASTYSASPTGPHGIFAPYQWLRIADNGTNRICSFSHDGQHWTTYSTIGRTSFLTADQVGIFVSGENAATPNIDAAMTLLSWYQH